MAPAGGGVKGFYRQAKKKRGGVVAKPSTSSKRAKNKPPQRCTAQDEDRGANQMDMKYGPCIGVTRLRRWERAAAMGLSPPPHIRYLLLLVALRLVAALAAARRRRPCSSTASGKEKSDKILVNRANIFLSTRRH